MIDRMPMLEAQVKARNAARAAEDAAAALTAARAQQARTDAATQSWRIKADDALRPTGVVTPAPVLGETPRQYASPHHRDDPEKATAAPGGGAARPEPGPR